MTQATQIINSLTKKPVKVYYASDRHSWNYEVRRYLMPKMIGEDVFSSFSTVSKSNYSKFELGSAIVLIGNYKRYFKSIADRYEIIKDLRLFEKHKKVIDMILIIGKQKS
jgi:hypothetical protein